MLTRPKSVKSTASAAVPPDTYGLLHAVDGELIVLLLQFVTLSCRRDIFFISRRAAVPAAFQFNYYCRKYGNRQRVLFIMPPNGF
jgi:hypothetical protein